MTKQNVFVYLGNVKKVGLMKIIHEKYKSNKKAIDPSVLDFHSTFNEALTHNKELGALVDKAQVEWQ